MRQNVNVPPLTLCRLIILKDNRITTLCTSWTTPSVTIVTNSYAHAQTRLQMLTVPNSEAEILSISKLPLDIQGNGWFATDLQVCKWTSDGDPRTGTFHQTQVTMGDIACRVKGI